MLAAVLGALCALAALQAHARVFDLPRADVDPYCLTCTGSDESKTRYQLIRGENELAKCNDRLYCDCKEHTQKQCGWLTALNPDNQKCAMFFSCESWLNGHTTLPPTNTPPTQPPTSNTPTTPRTAPTSPTRQTNPTRPTNPTVPPTAPTRPTPAPATPKPSSAWSNKATALTVVCLAAIAAL